MNTYTHRQRRYVYWSQTVAHRSAHDGKHRHTQVTRISTNGLYDSQSMSWFFFCMTKTFGSSQPQIHMRTYNKGQQMENRTRTDGVLCKKNSFWHNFEYYWTEWTLFARICDFASTRQHTHETPDDTVGISNAVEANML
jgi:hypothetical protein